MNIRESMEQREQKMLSPYAALSLCSRGRERQEEECDVRTVYQRDRDRILHSKAFRRMKDKTQVFVAPQGDHYRTRLTHTLEVSQIARTIAKALRLNEDLVEAIALGHDLGHTPFGHAGERALDAVRPVSLQKIDAAPYAKRAAEAHNNGLQSINCTIEKFHKFTSINSDCDGVWVQKSRRTQRQPHNPQTARSYWPSRHSSTASEKISPHASHSLRSISLASSSASPSVGGVSCSAIHWHRTAAEMIAR